MHENDYRGVYVFWHVEAREPSGGERCLAAVRDQCLLPVDMAYMGMTSEAIEEEIRSTDLRQTCAYVRVHIS